MMDGLAPILLFVYNRPWHTRKTVEALQKNELAQASELFIYSDASKDIEDQASVQKVRKYLQTIDGFKKVIIIERDKNWGLADSIIGGVTEIVNRYGKIIVLEDDLVTSPYFLKFMNEALAFYKDKKKVWHISGWNYPIDADNVDSAFLWRGMNCWGWATWVDRWSDFEKDTDRIIKKFSKQQIRYLNLDGYNDAWSQVLLNKEGKINTWAIYWYARIIEERGLCLNPAVSLVNNIGLDDSGIHCEETEVLYTDIDHRPKQYDFSRKLDENTLAVERVKSFFKKTRPSFVRRVVNRVKKIGSDYGAF